MSGDDIVTLVVVTHTNHLPLCKITRKYASDIMRGWFDQRELVRKGDKEDSQEVMQAWERLRRGTFANNVKGEDAFDSDEDYAQWIFAWEHVVGMYIHEHEVDPSEKWKEGSGE